MPHRTGKPRFLVVRGGAIGDFLMTLPAIPVLRTRWPDAYIECIGYPHVATLALEGGVVDKVTSLDRADMARFFSLRPAITDEQRSFVQSFNVILSYLYDADGTVRRNMLESGAKRFVYGSPIVGGAHAIEHLLKPLAELALFPEGGERPRLRLSDERRTAGGRRLTGASGRVVALHAGSGSPKKNWPPEKFLALAQAIRRVADFTPVFVAGEADAEVVEFLRGNAAAFPLLTGMTLLELAEVLSVCAGYVGNDSGVTHLAAALDIPVVALFGPSDADLWSPRGPRVRIIRSAERSTQSLAAIEMAAVLAAVRELLV